MTKRRFRDNIGATFQRAVLKHPKRLRACTADELRNELTVCRQDEQRRWTWLRTQIYRLEASPEGIGSQAVHRERRQQEALAREEERQRLAQRTQDREELLTQLEQSNALVEAEGKAGLQQAVKAQRQVLHVIDEVGSPNISLIIGQCGECFALNGHEPTCSRRRQ